MDDVLLQNSIEHYLIKLNEYKDDAETACTKISQIISDLDMYFEGSASKAMKSKLEHQLKELKSVIDDIVKMKASISISVTDDSSAQ